MVIVWVEVMNPADAIVTRYVPAGSAAKVHAPAASEIAWRTAPLLKASSVIRAAGTIAPLMSTTVPVTSANPLNGPRRLDFHSGRAAAPRYEELAFVEVNDYREVILSPETTVGAGAYDSEVAIARPVCVFESKWCIPCIVRRGAG